MSDEEFVGEYDEFDDEDEFGEEGFGGEDEFGSFDSFDEVADAAMSGDEDAEDEFIGGLLTKVLPIAGKILPSLLPQVLKFGKKILRGGSRRAVRAAPRVVRKAARVMRRRPRPYRRNPRRIAMLLHRLTRQLLQQL